MTRRSPLVWMFAAVCLAALAVSSRVAAKPPDLPVNPNDTIPILTPPPFDMLPPCPDAEPAKPEPLPAWPKITIFSPPFGIGDGASIRTEEDGERTTLTLYPGPQGVVVSIDPDPMSAPKTMTVYHPVRPRVPLSVQCTFDKCLLFGANPLLSLVPLPESLREEAHTKVEIPISPMPQAASDNSPMFGAGVNIDAGLTGILVGGITPAGATPDLSIPCTPASQEGTAPQHDDVPMTCPYAHDRHAPPVPDVDLSNSVLENLQKLIDAETLIDEARELVKNAKYADAIACINKACTLCPTSRYQEMAAEVVSSMVWRFLTGHHEDADAEEQAQPLIECEPYWFGDDEVPRAPKATPPAETSQIVIQALVAEIDLKDACDLLRTGSDAPVVFSASAYTFDRLLRNLKERGGLDVLSRPQVRALDNQSARVFIGQQFPIITGVTQSSGFATASVEYEPVGLDLMLTPKIESDGRVLMRVTTSVSAPQSCGVKLDGGITAELIHQQSMETTAITRDGQTVAIVGASQSVTNKVETRIPCLSELPVVGSLFRCRQMTKSRTALLVLLTPHVVHSKAEADKITEQEIKRTDRMLSRDDKQSQACAPACAMPCDPIPGVQEQVSGLMKACHLALSCGQHGKAIRLAREAYALDAERVAADPVVYKMHLVDLKLLKAKYCCDDDCCCDPCDCPDCCCHAKAANKGPQQCPPSCPVVQIRMPALPPVDPQVAVELQKLVDEGPPSVSEAKPNLEVIEEESEASEVPKAVAKPYRVQAPAANAVISYDDLLRIIPGETWTELDLKTNRIRVLWRARVGDKVYRVRYDGGLSVDLSVMPPAGTVENCEDPR